MNFVEYLSRWLETQVRGVGFTGGVVGCVSRASERWGERLHGQRSTWKGYEELTRSAGGLMYCVGKLASVETWDLGLTLKNGLPSISSE